MPLYRTRCGALRAWFGDCRALSHNLKEVWVIACQALEEKIVSFLARRTDIEEDSYPQLWELLSAAQDAALNSLPDLPASPEKLMQTLILAAMSRKATPLMIGSILHALVKGAKADYAVVKVGGEDHKPKMKSWLDTEVTMSVRMMMIMMMMLGVLMTMAALYIYSKVCTIAPYSKVCTTAPCEGEISRGPHSATEELEQKASTDEVESEMIESEEAKITKFMQLRQEELKQACSDRGLPVSGNKTDLARRLVEPLMPRFERPTEKQLSYIASLERKRGVATNPDAQLCKRKASLWIKELAQ